MVKKDKIVKKNLVKYGSNSFKIFHKITALGVTAIGVTAVRKNLKFLTFINIGSAIIL